MIALSLVLALSAELAVTPPPSYVALPDAPSAIAISRSGRVFVAFSRTEDPQAGRSLVELRGSGAEPYPPGFVQNDGAPAPHRLLSISALAVDERDRLWILDCGKVGTNLLEPGAAKLVAIDLASGRATQRIALSEPAVGATSFLRDLQIDLRHGVAYVSDASAEGPNAILVVELATGRATRRLDGLGVTRPDPVRVLRAEGRALVLKGGPSRTPLRRGVSALALRPDGAELAFAPLTGHRLYRIATLALLDASLDEEALRARVIDAGDKGFATEAMRYDPRGALYVGDVEAGALRRLHPDGRWDLVAEGARLAWPVALAIHPDRSILLAASQAHRGARLRGWDQRRRPFVILRVVLDEPHAAR